VTDDWRALLACPACHAALQQSGACSACDERYDLRGAVPELLPSRWRAVLEGPGGGRWREAMAGLGAWRARRSGSPRASGLDPRLSALLVRSGLRGTVLDVGGKDGAKAVAMPTGVTRYLSVDPGAQRQPEGLASGCRALVVRAVGEALPLRDGSVDGVFSTAALDYFVDPEAGVWELWRVLRPGGVLALLVTVHPPAVAQARDRPTRAGRALAALGPSVRREVGLRGALALAADGARATAREHTRYLDEARVLAWLGARFTLAEVQRSRGRYSTVLSVLGSSG
jgi:SAM-dependent methyltransferase